MIGIFKFCPKIIKNLFIRNYWKKKFQYNNKSYYVIEIGKNYNVLSWKELHLEQFIKQHYLIISGLYMKILTIVICNEPTRFKIETQRTFHGTNVCLRNVGFLGLPVENQPKLINWQMVKVHKFWEGHKKLWNLHLTFDWHYIGQK